LTKHDILQLLFQVLQIRQGQQLSLVIGQIASLLQKVSYFLFLYQLAVRTLTACLAEDAEDGF